VPLEHGPSADLCLRVSQQLSHTRGRILKVEKSSGCAG
jgi:hypothetical protein